MAGSFAIKACLLALTITMPRSQYAGQAQPSTPTAPTAGEEDRRAEWILAPIPISSEAMGTGIAPVAAYVFFPSADDKVSHPSVLAMAGLYTTTGTYGIGTGGTLSFADDRYRLAFLTGAARARYEFFGIGNAAGGSSSSIWLRQHGHAVFLQGLRRVGWNIFIGPRFSYRTIKAAQEDTAAGESPEPPPQVGLIVDQLNLSLTTAALGFRIEHDTRDSIFYPTRGSRMDARIDFFGRYIGSRYTFQSYVFEMNRYVPFGNTHVLALRAMGCGVSGERIPFYELCQFGMMGDLRGYQTGRYRDRAMFATQGEWRVILPWRLGATLFVGIGEVAPDGKSFNTENLLPSGGVGLRFNLSKQRRINLRLDVAYSRTGASWSMGVAELY